MRHYSKSSLKDLCNMISHQKFKPELINGIKYTTKVCDYDGEETHLEIEAFENNVKIGKLEYSDFENIPYIKMIEVSKDHRRNGIARELIKLLAKRYTYSRIDWGSLTSDGEKFKSVMDSEFLSM